VLRKLHRERRVSFTVSLIVKDGHVVSKQIIYGLGTTSVAKFVYILSDHLELSSLGQDVTTPWTDSPDESSRMVKVELSPGSAADLRRRAYSLDLSCLAMVFGCNARPNFIPAGL
jgi:hypothetical protein